MCVCATVHMCVCVPQVQPNNEPAVCVGGGLLSHTGGMKDVCVCVFVCASVLAALSELIFEIGRAHV